MMVIKVTVIVLINAFASMHVLAYIVNENSAKIQSQEDVAEPIQAIDLNSTQQYVEHNGCPWVPKRFIYPSGAVELHTEIEQFFEYMQPTRTERALRERVVARIKSVFYQLWPHAQLKLFGSVVIGLALPTSDIDLVGVGVSVPNRLQLLATQILANNVAEPNSITIIDSATVPIIKFVDRESKINIDMKLCCDSSERQEVLMSEYKQKYPKFVKLTLVLKLLMKERGLNVRFTGGITSHALTLMVINYLQTHPEDNNGANLGDSLLGLLELYGRKFNYTSTGITTLNGGAILPRNELPCRLVKGQEQLFCIQDANNPSSNAGSGTYRAANVIQAFDDAFVALSMPISSNERRAPNCTENSILSRIIHIDGHFIKYRNWIRNTFGHILLSQK
ncbi:non-canonical poly(A) RNA polymerase protein Trf4-1-like [Sitodiplosis mosellana]|uniref:non-canonical poly(A) RNA polymerase protein Trf4-1-like n=1 Tax=Sitodiplosis mosellana TaxID=263140 RepID=UPI002443BF98|nr:non-canonical poly(A) RNA polymerase protein Trf4-1-like [Sitodiplosis mosellana]